VPRPDATDLIKPRPAEQLQYTRDRTDYCWYLTSLDVPKSGEVELTVEKVADFFQVFLDGNRVALSKAHLLEDRGSIDGAGFSQKVRFQCEAGRHELAILVCALGLTKGDWMIEANMARERKGIWRRVLLGGNELNGPWHMRVFDPAPTIGFAAATATGEGPLAWHRLRFAAPREDRPLALDLGAMGKGMVWLNGQCLTRYWLLPIQESDRAHLEHDQLHSRHDKEPSQRYYHVPGDWLRDENELLVFEELGGGRAEAIRLVASETRTGTS
jgi:hypothetical protein